MTELMFLVQSDDEGGFTARAAGASIFTEGDSLDELRQNIREAVECHFEETARPRVVTLATSFGTAHPVWDDRQ